MQHLVLSTLQLEYVIQYFYWKWLRQAEVLRLEIWFAISTTISRVNYTVQIGRQHCNWSRWFPHFLMEPWAVSCFPRGLISLNTSVSYLIEPLPAAGDTQQHAVFRAEHLHLPGGSCLHHHGNKEHEEGLNDFIHGMMSPQRRRVSLDRVDTFHLPEIHKAAVSLYNIYVSVSLSGQTGPEPEHEVCRATVSGWQGWGEDTLVNVLSYLVQTVVKQE